MSNDPITVLYTNHRGETRYRRVIPSGAPYRGRNEWHPELQWLLPCIDAETGKARDFALKDCNFAAAEVAEQTGVRPDKVEVSLTMEQAAALHGAPQLREGGQ